MPRDKGLPTPDEAEANYQAGIKARNEKIAELRRRSGLSMDELAKAMGYAGQSSIQRYLSPDYDMGFRPEIASKFRRALLGRGNPPINDLDLQVFLDGRLIRPGDPVYDREGGASHSTGVFQAIASVDRKTFFSGKIKAALPVAEGEMMLEMPSNLSHASAEAARVWVAHLINLATDQNINNEPDAAPQRKDDK